MKNVKSVFSLFVLLAVLAIGLAYRPVSVKAFNECDCVERWPNGELKYAGIRHWRLNPDTGTLEGYCVNESCGNGEIE